MGNKNVFVYYNCNTIITGNTLVREVTFQVLKQRYQNTIIGKERRQRISLSNHNALVINKLQVIYNTKIDKVK